MLLFSSKELKFLFSLTKLNYSVTIQFSVKLTFSFSYFFNSVKVPILLNFLSCDNKVSVEKLPYLWHVLFFWWVASSGNFHIFLNFYRNGFSSIFIKRSLHTEYIAWFSKRLLKTGPKYFRLAAGKNQRSPSPTSICRPGVNVPLTVHRVFHRSTH